MITFEAHWEGQSDREFIEQELAHLRSTAEAAVLEGALFFEGRVKEILTGSRSGRTYPVPGKRHITYIASAPGEPPASPLGDLRKSITHSMPVWTGQEVSSEVGTAMIFARILEFGGLTGLGHATRILPRPYFAPAWLSAQSELDRILSKAVQS